MQSVSRITFHVSQLPWWRISRLHLLLPTAGFCNDNDLTH